MNKNFILLGAAGYIAPRHMQAIKDTKNILIAAMDRCDSVGIMDSFFPDSNFFTEFEMLDIYLDKLKSKKILIDFTSIATPNYLHDAHIRWALKSGSDAICEKPLVLDIASIEQLKSLEKKCGKKVYTILQLRLHDSILDLKAKIQEEIKKDQNKIFNIDLTYLTSRGKWYFASWKGDEKKSGGIATNIGVHFFDMLTWIFGDVKESIVHLKTPLTNAGYLRLKHAHVRWFLSVEYEYIPEDIKRSGQRTYRSITIDGEEIEFSGGFTNLHTKSYEEILNGNGFGLDEAYSSINIVSTIRETEPIGLKGEYHPFCKKVLY